MDVILSMQKWKYALVQIDELAIVPRSVEEQMKRTEMVFSYLEKTP